MEQFKITKDFYQHKIVENSLEWITYYENIHFPQFTPINYYLYTYRKGFTNFNILGSLIIAEILPLFQDYPSFTVEFVKNTNFA